MIIMTIVSIQNVQRRVQRSKGGDLLSNADHLKYDNLA